MSIMPLMIVNTYKNYAVKKKFVNKLSYFKNHDLVDFGGKYNPNSEGMLEP